MIRVLLVDDEPIFLTLSKTYLEMEPDIRCETCESSATAIDRMRHSAFDTIVSDYDMPGMNGIDFLKTVRDENTEIPFILFTGKGREDVVIEALNNGADFYLQKGSDPDSVFSELVHKIRHAVARKRAESALRISEDKFHKAFYSNPHVMTIAVLETGEYLDVNESFESVMGYSREEAIGKTSLELDQWWDPADRPRLVEILRREHRVRDDVVIFKARSGRKLIWKVSGEIIELQGRQHVIWAFTDITEQKEAEDECRISESNLAASQRIAHVGSYSWNAEKNLLTWSDEFYRILGLAPGEVTPAFDTYATFIHPDDREEAMKRIPSVLRKNAKQSSKHRIVRRDGTVRFVEMMSRVFLADDERPRMIHGVILDVTERRRTEEALRESKEKYRQFFDQDLTGDLITSVDGRILACNPAFAEIFGFGSIEEARKSNIADTYLSPDDRKKMLESLRKEKKLANISKVRKKRDGSPINVVENVVGRFDEDGSLVEIRSYIYDDSERKQAEEALQESIRRERARASELQAVLDAVPAAIFISLDPQCRTMTGSRMTYELLHMTPESNLSKSAPEHERPATFRAMKDGAEVPAAELPMQKAAATGEPISDYELDLIFTDGTKCNLFGNAVPLTDENGRPRGAISAFVDITQRKEMEKELQESEERLGLAIESAHLGVWDKNFVTGEVITDDHWPVLLGYAPGDPIPPWRREVHPEDYPRIRDIMRNHMLGLTPYAEAEYRMKRKDGQYSWIFTRGKVVARDTNGRALRMTGVDHDVSPQHHDADALREANKKLNLLTSITRHDILNQVMTLRGFLQLLEKQHPGNNGAEKLFEQLRTIADTIRRQITFTGDYQHMGEHAPEWQRVEEVVKRAARSVPLNGARLRVLTGPVEVFADPMLEKAFFNLLDNAVVHGDGVTEVRISFLDEGDCGVIVVEDDGTGIPPFMKSSIFEKGVGKNTGYGLFLVREILDITGMTISETGGEDAGARFEIVIPKGRWRIS